ncbi:TPA: helix-turn-helix domain-containing protein [Serratia fonticola]
MSMNLMARAMGIKVGNHLRKLVLLKMADNANDKGECWPSYQHVADHCECSKSAVKSHIAALIEMGLISKVNRLGVRNGKGNTSNVYHLTLDNPVPVENPAPKKPKKANPESPESIGGESPESTPPVASESTGEAGDNPPESPESTPPVSPAGTRISHSLEPVMEPVSEPKEKPPLTPQVVDNSGAGQNQTAGEVFDYLNLLTGAKTRPDLQALKSILDRLTDGYTQAELKLVAEHRTEQHLNNPKLAHMLSSNLLFAAQTFGAYLAAANAWQTKRDQQAATAAAVERQSAEHTGFRVVNGPDAEVPEIDFDEAFDRLLVDGGQPENQAEKIALAEIMKIGYGPHEQDQARKKWRVSFAKARARTTGEHTA